jgi:hypothetical protein
MMDSSVANSAAAPAPGQAGAAADASRPHLPDTCLAGRQLRSARIAWAVAAVLLVGLHVLLFPAFLAQLQTMCSGVSCAQVQPSPTSAHALHLLGISLGGYAALTFTLILFAAVVCFTVAGVIVWRKSDDWMALLVALALLAAGILLVPYLLESGRSAWQLPAIVVNTLDFVVLFLLFAIFPNGRFVPRWTRWVVVGWVVASVALVVPSFQTGELRFVVYGLVWLAAIGCVTGAQVYRYRVVSSPHEQAQTRWVIFGAVSAIIFVFAVDTPTFLFPALGQHGSLYRLLTAPVYTLPIILLAVCIGMAILRSHLYDIDVIIRRTLIYGVVTGALAVVYISSVVLLQLGFHAITGQGSSVAIVASTLAIVGLFQPVRGLVQAAVDQRFYRGKYDAERTLEAFGATLSNEMDLAQLRERLLDVVQETMQPEHLSLWLCTPQYTGEQSPVQAVQHQGARAAPEK